jgi:hypothetical protein
LSDANGLAGKNVLNICGKMIVLKMSINSPMHFYLKLSQLGLKKVVTRWLIKRQEYLLLVDEMARSCRLEIERSDSAYEGGVVL